MEINRLFDVLFYQLEQSPLERALSDRKPNGWVHYSTADLVKSVNSLSAGLLNYGIQKQDRVAIASYNCSEWVIADNAISQIGGVNVPLYPNASADDYRYILDHSETKLVFCGDREILARVEEAIADMTYPPRVVTFSEEVSGDKSWKSLMLDYDDYESVIVKRRAQTLPMEMATIIYTSGTTGRPKGVMLSHRNILANCDSLTRSYILPQAGERLVSFLPLCHIFERTSTYHYMRHGIEIYFVNDLDNLGDYIREVKPQYFNTVPRMLEKVYEKLIAAGNALTGIKKKLFFWAVGLAEKHEPYGKQSLSYSIQLKLADKLIYSKWRIALGGNIKYIISGAAALQPRLVRIFWAAKIYVMEAYGLTEASPGISLSYPEKGLVVPGCVGRVIDGVEVKFDEDGEILVRGENVMMGYYKNPEETAKVLHGEWLRTGDVGELTNGLLRITDRKKEIFKTSGGKYIAPQKIENLMKAASGIEQILVLGEGRKFPSALIVPNEAFLKTHADIDLQSQEEAMQRDIEVFNDRLAQYEKIKKIRIVQENWDVENGLLTPTMKMKRKKILSRYNELIESMYDE
ncbi:AMP-dependent synthetase/ligase [Fulvivirga sedimenti]|uniref:Long-chain fatty acid--CoA ligase n=1 Tax=Fulvivirga sedimenti TaxID=2879465 RepID=A0A9X1L1R9_9BACT|nr:long-chain fatty acid--CoA ligase [Fulvivirga sedimenti]MCA6078512.1 long-chain fatty acid--CoA ligase [Fulvivirga sedimenti]